MWNSITRNATFTSCTLQMHIQPTIHPSKCHIHTKVVSFKSKIKLKNNSIFYSFIFFYFSMKRNVLYFVNISLQKLFFNMFTQVAMPFYHLKGAIYCLYVSHQFTTLLTQVAMLWKYSKTPPIVPFYAKFAIRNLYIFHKMISLISVRIPFSSSILFLICYPIFYFILFHCSYKIKPVK